MIILRAVRNMPYRRRHFGMSCLDILNENRILKLLRRFIVAAVVFGNIGNIVLRNRFLQFSHIALEHCIKRTMVWTMDAIIDPINKTRNIDSFTDEECYNNFRFRKEKLKKLFRLFKSPIVMTCQNDISCSGEYAFLILVCRLVSYLSL